MAPPQIQTDWSTLCNHSFLAVYKVDSKTLRQKGSEEGGGAFQDHGQGTLVLVGLHHSSTYLTSSVRLKKTQELLNASTSSAVTPPYAAHLDFSTCAFNLVYFRLMLWIYREMSLFFSSSLLHTIFQHGCKMDFQKEAPFIK